MSQQGIINIMSGAAKGPAASVARAALACLSLPYSAAMRLRRRMYACGILASAGAGVATICVGNITAGGTGKTPMVAWVTECLKSIGQSPAILTRGYKSVGGCSDEAQLLMQLSGVAVIVNSDRIAGARHAISEGANVLVMDDGYQHLRLRRDLNIVLIDASNPFGFGWCLPRGLLREPPGALRDANAIVITRSDSVSSAQLDSLRTQLASLSPSARIFLASHRPVAVTTAGGESSSPESLSGRKCFAFCGLGNPGAFYATLRSLGAELVGEISLDDHAAYDIACVDRIMQQASACGAQTVITTDKDWVKLASVAAGRDISRLTVRMEIVDGVEQLQNMIRTVVVPG